MIDKNAATAILKAMDDPTRFTVIDLLLQDKAMSVADMMHIIGIEPTLFSHHLKILRDVGLVVSSRSAKNVIYSLAKSVKAGKRSVKLNGVKVTL